MQSLLKSLLQYLFVAQCQPRDSDSCLQASLKWKLYTCTGSSKYCESWGKDMKRCCPETCKTGAFNEADCNSFSGKGDCKYPNSAQCPKTGSLRNNNDRFLFFEFIDL